MRTIATASPVGTGGAAVAVVDVVAPSTAVVDVVVGVSRASRKSDRSRSWLLDSASPVPHSW
jgi:hypothetical protein